MARFLFLVASLLFFASVRANNESVAIIGAGYSGLSTAYHLVKKGYTNIVIYEKSFRLGGYAASLRHNNVTHDYTIYGMLPTYWRFLRAMDGIGIKFCKLLFDIVDTASSPPEIIPLEDFVPRTVRPFVRSPKQIEPRFRKQVAKYAKIWSKLFDVEYVDSDFRTERIFARKPRTKAIARQLAMPMEKFVKKNGLDMLKDIFIALTDSQAYGIYKTTPAVYHMSWLAPHGFARIDDNTVPCGEYDSFQAIADRLGDWLNDKVTFRLGVPVKEVIRNGKGATVVEGDSGAMQDYDRVVVTARLPKVGRREALVKPMLLKERRVAATVEELQVYSAVIDGPRKGALDTRFSAIDYEAVRRADDSPWWVVLNCEKRNISNADQYRNYERTTRASALFYYAERARNETVKAGSTEREVDLLRHMKKWDNTDWRIVSGRHNEAYFQRWGPKGVRQMLPWAISDVQGHSGVYYVNAGTCGFESVGSVFDCSYHLVQEQF